MAPRPKLMVRIAALSFGLTERKVVTSYLREKKKIHPPKKWDKDMECCTGKSTSNKNSSL